MSAASLALLLLVAQPPLPIVRPVAPPPAVRETGVEPRSDGATATVPVTPGFALADLTVYDWDVGTVFSLAAPSVPADSLAAARGERAHAWAARLPAAGSGPLMDSVLRAEVEAAANDDAAAVRTFDAVVRAAPRARRSYVLARAVATFTNGEVDDSALARRLTIAERFLAQLAALPRGGYATMYDSLALADRTWDAAIAVLAASARLGDTARVAAHITSALAALRRCTGGERVVRFANGPFPYEAVATTLLGEPRPRARIDALTARLLSAVALSSAELAESPPADRAALPDAITQMVVGRIAEAALLGHRAPPLSAHAWLNTPDSVYQPTPRTRSLDDGTIRLVYFPPFGWPDQGYLAVFAALDRLQRVIAPWGQVVIVAHTTGHVGTEIVEPADEVAWSATFARDEAHLTPVVALWAGDKGPGRYEGRVPVESPNDSLYQALLSRFSIVLVDGRGTVRGVARLDLRPREEAVLARLLGYLHAEATDSAAAAARPAQLVPRSP